MHIKDYLRVETLKLDVKRNKLVYKRNHLERLKQEYIYSNNGTSISQDNLLEMINLELEIVEEQIDSLTEIGHDL